MKDIVKIVERMKKDCAEIQGFEAVHTIKEGLDILANKITLGEGKAVIPLFKKYGIYEADYIRESMKPFYPFIEEEVAKRETKELIKAGASAEEIERRKILEDLGENRIIGYARVSTREQNLGRQLVALEEAGCQYIFQEKVSGKSTDRKEYKEMLNLLKAGDVLVIADLTRIARSTTDLFKIMADLDAKGVQVKSIKESWLDTTTAQGRLMFTIMAGLSQFERELMLERQSEGIRVAVENGVKFGVKLSEDADLDLAIQLVKDGKFTTTQIAKMCHISRSTLWRRCKELGIK